jgi:hypothetical protein
MDIRPAGAGGGVMFVMPGLVSGIHVLLSFGEKDVDGRDRRAEATPSFGRLWPGHDEN